MSIQSDFPDLLTHKYLWEELFQHSPVGVCTLGPDLQINQINPTYCKWLGREAANLIGSHAMQYILKEDQAETQNALDALIAGELDVQRFEKRCLREDGITLYLDVQIRPIKNEAQDLIGLIEIATDLTAQKDTERASLAVQQSAEAYNVQLEQQIDLLAGTQAFIWLIDLEGNFRYVNQAAPGFDKATLLSQSIYDFPPEIYKQTEEKAAFVLKTKQPLIYHADIPDPEGVVHSFVNLMTPATENGEITGFMMISTEITQTRQLKQMLDEQKALQQMAFKAVSVGTWEQDVQGTGLLKMDPLCLQQHSMPQAEFDGTLETYFSFIHSEDREALRHNMAYAAENLSSYNGSYRILKPDSEEVAWISFRAEYIRNEAGELLKIKGISWDSTAEKEEDRRKAEIQKLNTQNSELKEFVYVASHDLQTPLRTVQNYIELLTEDVEDELSEDARYYLSVIDRAAGRMSNLIKDLLDYSRLSKVEKLEWIETGELLQEVLCDLQPTIDELDAKLDIQPLPRVMGFATHLTLLFQNLLTNALKFHRPNTKPHITIQAELKDEDWVFCIKDNGIGIAPENHEKIFAIFKRLHSHTEYKGTGIGLAHCARITSLHGGEIWVESQEGEGSAFFFSISKKLPLLHEKAS